MDIIKVIQETATWIERVNNDFETNLFRTKELSPKYYYYQIPNDDKLSVINRIISKRSALLAESGEPLIAVSELHEYGRVMIFDADETVVDGAPEAESACFVDIGDTPPWDTWLTIGEQLNRLHFYKSGHEIKPTCLIAWVPKSHYYYANSAVEVACVDNFSWPSNEFINSKYDSLKELFSKPDIVEPSVLFDSSKVNKVLKVVQLELESNSKLYYENVRARYATKKSSRYATEKSFWSKLNIWKTRG